MTKLQLLPCIHKLSNPCHAGKPVARRQSLLHQSVLTNARRSSPRKIGGRYLHLADYSFLIESRHCEQRVLFDLAFIQDFNIRMPPSMKPLLAGPEKVMAIDVVQDIPDTLKLHNIHLSTINAIIWSHSHIDHIGDPSDFPPTTELVVGPGFKAHSILAYPSNPNSPLLDDAFQGRSIREVDFSNSTTTVSGFRAIDYFGDTSFWLLEAPGHTAHHICALCRTTGDSWILLGGDACHHPTCDTVAKAMQSSRSEAVSHRISILPSGARAAIGPERGRGDARKTKGVRWKG